MSRTYATVMLQASPGATHKAASTIFSYRIILKFDQEQMKGRQNALLLFVQNFGLFTEPSLRGADGVLMHCTALFSIHTVFYLEGSEKFAF